MTNQHTSLSVGRSGEEVELIVAWLRGQAAIFNDQNPDFSALPEWTLAQKWANAIERGEYKPAQATKNPISEETARG